MIRIVVIVDLIGSKGIFTTDENGSGPFDLPTI
jgi:hypothetical protein